MTTDDVHDAERRAAGPQQQIDKSPHEETAGLLIDDVDEVAVLRDGPVGTPDRSWLASSGWRAARPSRRRGSPCRKS
jgi:hypothetical protein